MRRKICLLILLLYIAEISFCSLSGKKIGVDPGHGGSDPGSGCFGYWEEDFTLAVCLKLRDYLQNDGATVVMTRTTDTDVDLTTRYTLFNSNNCNISLCVHNNSAGCPSTAHGVETLYCSLNAYPSSSQTLATKILNRDLQFVKNDSRGVKECLDVGRGFHFAMTRYPNMPATLSENYFITNEEECMTIHASDTGRDKVARAHYAGTCDYFGVPVNLPAVGYQAKLISFVYPQSVYSGNRYQVQLYMLNEGTVTWTTDKTKLVVVNPRGKQSVFYDSTTWLSADSICFVNTNVSQNSQAVFSFYIKAPAVSQQTQYTEYFNLYQTGVGYFSDYGGPSDTEVKMVVTVYPSSTTTSPPSGETGEFNLSDIVVSKSTFVPVNNEIVTISYNVILTTSALQTLKIYNSVNQCVKTIYDNVIVTAGTKSVVWNGTADDGNIVATGKYKIYVKLLQGTRSIEKNAYIFVYSDKPIVEIATPISDTLNVVDTGVKIKVNVSSIVDLQEVKSKIYLYSKEVLKETVVRDLLYSQEGCNTCYYTVIKDIPQDVDKFMYEVVTKDIYGSSATIKSDFIFIVPIRAEEIILKNGGNVVLTDANPDDGESTIYISPQQKTGNIKVKFKKLDRFGVERIKNNMFVESYVDYPVAVYEIDTEPQGVYFTTPVKISLVYPDDNNDGFDDVYNTQVEKLKVFCYTNRQWQLVGGEVDKIQKTISFSSYHFSIYAIFPVKSNIKLTAEYFKPSVKIVSTKNYVSFNSISNFQKNTTIKIYDIKGRLIKVLENKDIWDLTDEKNSVVSSGVYIYQYNFDGKTITGTISVVK